MKASSLGWAAVLLAMFIQGSNAIAGETFKKVLDCNNGAIVVDRGVGMYSGESQVVIREQNVIQYFEKQFGFQIKDKYGQFLLRTLNTVLGSGRFVGKLDFAQDISAQYHPDLEQHASLIVETIGNGLQVDAVMVNTWLTEAWYEEATGLWRGIEHKTVQSIANWYFEDCR